MQLSAIRDVTIRAQAQGVAETAAATERLGAAVDQTAASTERLERRQLSVDRAYDRLQRQIDATYRQSRLFEQGQRTVDRAFEQGRISSEQYQRSLDLLAQKYGQVSRASDAANDNAAEAARAMEAAAAAAEAAARRVEAYRSAVDPAHAAQTRFNAAIHEAEDLYTSGAISVEHYRLGVAKATAELNAANQASTRFAANAQNAFNAQIGVRSDFGTAGRSEDVAAYGRAIDAVRAKYVPLAAAQQQYRATLLEINAAAKAGALTEMERAAAIERTKSSFAAHVVSLRQSGEATEGVAKSSGLARHELINLSRQFQDVATMAAMGADPMQIISSQAAQIVDIFSSSQGTVGGFFRQLMGWLIPLAPVIAGVTIAATALWQAFRILGEQQGLSNSLLGAGRAAGVTSDQLNRLAVEAANSSDVTVSSARSIATEFTRTGKVGMENLSMLTKLTKDYAANTGLSMQEAARELASGLMDTSRGIEQATQRLGPLNSTYVAAARSAEEFGDKLRAQKAYIDAVRDSTVSAEQAQSKWNQAMDKYVYRPAAAAGEFIGGIVVGPSDAEQRQKRVRDLEAQIAGLQAQLRNDVSTGNRYSATETQRTLATKQAELKVYQDAAAAREREAQSTARVVEENGKVNVAAALANSALKDELALRLRNRAELQQTGEALEILIQRRNTMAGKLGTPEFDRNAWKTLNDQIRDVTAAQEKYGNQAKDQARVQAGLTAEQDKAIARLEVEKRYQGELTLAQRIARAGEMAEIDNRNTLTSSAERQTNALIEQNKVRQEAANNHASENQRASEANATLERQIQILRQGGIERAKIEDLRQRAVQGGRQEGVDPSVVMARLLRQEMNEQRREIAQNNAEKARGVALDRQANDAAAGGVMSAARRSQLQEELRQKQEVYNKLMSTGLVSEAEANKIAGERVKLVQQEGAERARTTANNYLFGQQQTIESLEKELRLLGETRDLRSSELELLRTKQYLQEQNISLESQEGQLILQRAARIGELTEQLRRQRRAQDEVRQAQDFAADSLKSFIDELLTGTDGINGALKSLGRGFLSASLDALISGKGPLAGLTGMSGSRDQQGGLLGALSNGLNNLGKEVEKGAAKGSATGTVAGFTTVASNDNFNFLSGLGISGKDLAGGLTAIAGLAGAYGSGMAAGSFGQAVGGGAVSGAMSGLALAGTGVGASLGGAAILGPIGAILGAGLGFMGQQAARKAAREERERQAQENYRNAKPQIETMRSQLRGEPQDTLQKRIAETEAATMKLAEAAFFASKTQEAHDLYADFMLYKTRSMEDFQRAFGGLVDSLQEGLGPNSAFSSARDAVKQTGDVLKGFVDDAEFAFGEGSAQIEQARQAALAHALTIMDGARTLSMVQTRMEEIRGAGAALQQVLVDLGMSAQQAADAVQSGTVAALDRLRDAFNTDLVAKVNEVEGVGYIDELQALFREVSQMRLDAGAIGGRSDLVDRYLIGKAQEIVDSAQLTGSAFDTLIAVLPELSGLVSEFTGGLKGAAREADIAARRLAAMDRIFAATNDNSTLEGQLAAYDRAAMREREEEIRKGGEAMAELEAAHLAERFNIVKAWNQRILDDQKRAADEAKSYFERFTRQIREYVDGLRAGSNSPLSPEARLQAAQSQYAAQLALAQGGNRDALNGITGYSGDLLEAAKAMYASGPQYQAIFNQLLTQLEALPAQLSAEQFIVNAIEAGAANTVSAISVMQGDLRSVVQSNNPIAIGNALSGYFGQLDTSLDGLLTPAEFVAGLGPLATSAEQAAARAIFTSIDQNGDGMISAIEAMQFSLVSAVQANNATAFATALNANFNKLDTSVNGLLDYNEVVAALGPKATKQEQEWARAIFNSIDADGDGQISKMEAVRIATVGTTSAVSAQDQLLNAIRTFTQSTNANAASIAGAAEIQKASLAAINTGTSNNHTQLGNIYSSVASGASYTYQAKENLRFQNANRFIPNNPVFSPIPAYATGGWIGGVGTGTSDSNMIMASRGEFMMREAAASRFGPMLEYMNDNLRLPPMPAHAVPFATGGGDGAMLAELKALRASNERLERQVAALTQSNADGHKRTAAAVDENTGAVKADTKTSRRGQAPAGRAAA